MSIDFTKIQMLSSLSSNKVLMQGTGSFVVPALPGAGEVSATQTIAHNYGSDNLLFQVRCTTDITGTSGDSIFLLPWSSNDNSTIIYYFWDSTNLYITRNNNSFVSFPATTVSYSYRILVP